KPAVRGEVFWKDAKFSITIVGDRRIFTGNGLPVDVPTGIFPIGKDDPAFRYDQNPNSIKVHDVSFSLPTNPTMAEAPSCIRPPVGIALDGVRFSSALDSLARDEMAYQIQDRCSGQSQPGGIYHRHAGSDCIPHVHENNALVGYALDGF